MPIPPVIEPPDDLFTREISPVLDDARGIIASLGLRPYRVFLVIDRYEGPRRKQGALEDRELTEILPPPVVAFNSTAKIAMSGGALVEGSATLREISRRYTKETLVGRDLSGGDLPLTWDFWIAVLQIGQIHALGYTVAGEPVLEPTSWSMPIRPIGTREPLNPVGPD